MDPLLHRYWLQLSGEEARARGLGLGCGVTAHDLADARRLVQEQLFDGAPLPPLTGEIGRASCRERVL